MVQALTSVPLMADPRPFMDERALGDDDVIWPFMVWQDGTELHIGRGWAHCCRLYLRGQSFTSAVGTAAGSTWGNRASHRPWVSALLQALPDGEEQLRSIHLLVDLEQRRGEVRWRNSTGAGLDWDETASPCMHIIQYIMYIIEQGGALGTK